MTPPALIDRLVVSLVEASLPGCTSSTSSKVKSSVRLANPLISLAVSLKANASVLVANPHTFLAVSLKIAPRCNLMIELSPYKRNQLCGNSESSLLHRRDRVCARITLAQAPPTSAVYAETLWDSTVGFPRWFW